jgi:hypothetical protein
MCTKTNKKNSNASLQLEIPFLRPKPEKKRETPTKTAN